MRILIIGSGGREHALAWTLARSPRADKVFIAPGNAGTVSVGTNVDIAAGDVDTLLAFARNESIDLTVVGPEVPLVAGLVDAFEEDGLKVVGPSAAAARLEGSKAFAKAFMAEHGIPTAAFESFSSNDYEAARAYLAKQGAPIVVKASGLAAGKGAVVCEDAEQAAQVLDEMLNQHAFGEASDQVVIEEFMVGEEASVFALADGTNYVLLAPAQDHKQIGEGDVGPNTGGMGAYAPAPVVTAAVLDRVKQDIIEPTLRGMADAGHPYRGVLYVGLMITANGPKVVEYNCRLGDPEAQVVLPLLETDLVDVFQALVQGRLDEVDLRMRPGAAACVVMASEGYPGSYEKGFVVEGLDDAVSESALVFHAGTRRDDDSVRTNGGRVLGVTGLGSDLQEALDTAYAAVEKIRFDGAQYRRDIGRKGLARLESL